MKNVFREFAHLWPRSSWESLEPLLKEVSFLFYPDDSALIKQGSLGTRKTIIIIQSATVSEMMELLSIGYSHCVQMNRPDFPQELLASCLMSERPLAFVNDPMPFFFTGFKDPLKNSYLERQMVLPITKSSDKRYLLNRLELFLVQNGRLKNLSDVALQVADELVTNAVFSAPIDFEGTPLFADEPRTNEVVLANNKRARFFAAFSDERLILGCEDLYGSLRKDFLMDHLLSVFRKEKAQPKSHTAGAGLGFKYMIENCTNFYIYSEKNKRTLVACGFLLENLRSNRSNNKHIHLSCTVNSNEK